MDINYWILFFTAAFLICISPGPDLIYIISKTAAQGAKSGIFASMGICTGAFIHVLMSALGLSAIMAASATAFTVVKFIGAAFLFYIGVKAIFSKSDKTETRKLDNFSEWKTFRQGFLVDLFNPKVSIFFMAFLPQFVRTGYGSTGLQIVYLGALVVITGLIIEIVIVLSLSRITKYLNSNSRHSHILSKLLGTTFIGLGVRLALSAR